MNSGLYFFIYYLLSIIFFFSFYLGLRIRFSMMLYSIITVTVTQSHIIKNIEDSRTIILYYISTIYNIYGL